MQEEKFSYLDLLSKFREKQAENIPSNKKWVIRVLDQEKKEEVGLLTLLLEYTPFMVDYEQLLEDVRIFYE
jgi:hypothetical protein